MQISILKETRVHESRFAGSLVAIDKFVKRGFSVVVEQGAGLSANLSDAALEKAGAKIAKDAKSALENVQVILKVRMPQEAEIKLFSSGQTLICHLEPYLFPKEFKKLVEKEVNLFALERIPRISRAQSMDILSSQANVAGYKAVIDAFQTLPRVIPMMMTAAGTIRAAKVLVMGVGVAGLQAIATAKRMGAVVSATDVRPSTKEQVESLGAKFVAVVNDEFLNAQTAGGYAKPMSEAYQKEQNELIKKVIAEQDIVITTALIPNRKAPILVDEAMVQSMPKDAVIVDLAASQGGNCALTVPDELVQKHGVNIIGYTNFASRLAQTTSELLAKNILNFLELFQIKADSPSDSPLQYDIKDPIIHDTLVASGGKVNFEEFEKLLNP